MKFLSLCSGIEAASVAWHPLGWEAVAVSEIDKFPSAVLAHHHPHVPNWGDMTKFKEWPDAAFDLLVGGTPCQSFSVAGLRKGLADPRGNLMLTYLAIAARYRPRWLVWENVPGVLSSNGGRDFGTFLAGLGELGYGFAYRVLDAQYVRVESHPRAVPQRRRRVFVVGHSGGRWQRAAAVLFERESLRGHPAPRRETGEGTAPSLAARTRGGCGLGTDAECDGALIPDVAPTMRAGGNRTGGDRPYGTDVDTCDSLIPTAFAIQAGALRENPNSGPDGVGIQQDHAYTLEARAEVQAVAFDLRGREGGAQFEGPHDTANIRAASGGSSRSYVAFTQNQRDEVREVAVAGAIAAKPGMKQQTYLSTALRVRRLTPKECERLQGFPDDYTLIPYNGKPAKDGPRYKALGNSMAVNCMSWLGQRIQAVQSITLEFEDAA